MDTKTLMRRVSGFTWLVLIFALLLGWVAGSWYEQTVSDLPAEQRASAVQRSENEPDRQSPTIDTTTATVLDGAAQGEQPPTQQEHATVLAVVDGDTIEVRMGGGRVERVRYIGIDTPETVHPSKPVQCFGKEASAKNRELVEGREVALERDITDRDKYGRLLRYVYVSDVFVNGALVRGGYAHAYPYPPDVRYEAQFREDERLAREEGVGLWSGVCDTHVSTPAPVYDPDPTSRQGCIIKGNVSASGDKIYHVPSCKSYDKTVITEDKGERWFCTEEDALEAGWRKALNC